MIVILVFFSVHGYISFVVHFKPRQGFTRVIMAYFLGLPKHIGPEHNAERLMTHFVDVFKVTDACEERTQKLQKLKSLAESCSTREVRRFARAPGSP